MNYTSSNIWNQVPSWKWIVGGSVETRYVEHQVSMVILELHGFIDCICELEPLVHQACSKET
ncbi:Uncharacterised protein [Segatella copri]|nr:Uncharacterised protein [Segatella copri]